MKNNHRLESKVILSIVGGLAVVLIIFIMAVSGSAVIFTHDLDYNLNKVLLEQKFTSIEATLKDSLGSFKIVDGKMKTYDDKDITFRMLKELASLKRTHSVSIFAYDTDGKLVLSTDLSKNEDIEITDSIKERLDNKEVIFEKLGKELNRQTYIKEANNGIIYAITLTDKANISNYFTDFNVKISLFISLVGIVVLVIFALGIIIFARNIVKCIVALRDFTEKLANYDYSVAVSEKILSRKDEIGDLGRGLCTTRKTTIDLITRIKESTISVVEGSTEITNLNTSVMSITTNLSEVSTSITEESVAQATSIGVINSKILDINEVGSELTTEIVTLKDKEKDLEKACKISKNSIDGLVRVGDENSELLNKIKDSVDKTSISINSINAVLDLITKITEDTKLLSLNARIEAARVGEAGRGFAVVANEIQNLATSSKSAIEEVEKTLEIINSDINSTLGYTEQIKGAIEKQKKVISKNKDTNIKIEQVKENISGVLLTLDKSTATLTNGINSIVDEMGVINDSANQNASSTEEMLACTEEQLSSIHVIQDKVINVGNHVEGLSELISKFKC